MSRYFTSLLTLSVILGLGSTPNGRAESSLQITVWIYNYAQVSSWTLIRAERVATKIFYQAGIETVWLNNALSKVPQQPFGATILALKILPESMAAPYDRKLKTLGFAVPSPEGGTHASVFYQRVKELAKGTVETEPEILGHALAHEIGHLLLGSTAHDPTTGIMHTNWSREVLHQMSWQYLFFSPEQAEVLRANVLGRIKLQEGHLTDREYIQHAKFTQRELGTTPLTVIHFNNQYTLGNQVSNHPAGNAVSLCRMLAQRFPRRNSSAR